MTLSLLKNRLGGGVKVSGWKERRLLVLGATGGVGRFVSEEGRHPEGEHREGG